MYAVSGSVSANFHGTPPAFDIQGQPDPPHHAGLIRIGERFVLAQDLDWQVAEGGGSLQVVVQVKVFGRSADKRGSPALRNVDEQNVETGTACLKRVNCPGQLGGQDYMRRRGGAQIGLDLGVKLGVALPPRGCHVQAKDTLETRPLWKVLPAFGRPVHGVEGL